MFKMTENMFRSTEQQVWNNDMGREKLWVAEGGAGKLWDASESGKRKYLEEDEIGILTAYDKEEGHRRRKKLLIGIVATAVAVFLIGVSVWTKTPDFQTENDLAVQYEQVERMMQEKLREELNNR